MHCSCIGSKPFFEELKLWIPLLLLSAIAIVLPIVLGGDVAWTLIGYGIFFGLNAIFAWCMGRLTNYGWFPKYVETNKRLEGRTAIVTGANRFVPQKLHNN